MGIISKLFGSSSKIEKLLETQYVFMFQTMQGMTHKQAKSIFRNLIKMAKEKSLKEGTSKLPPNFGNILLEKESINPYYKTMLAKKRNQDVRDEDIRWWWNMHDLERIMMIESDNLSRLAFMKKLIDDGINEEEAGKRVHSYFPIFGDPDSGSIFTGEDRPLPIELKDRINIYVQKRSQIDLEKFNNEIKESSSFNALIRKEIKNRKI